MSYRNLQNFQDIFRRDDFNYISNPTNIKHIKEIILYRLSYPDGNEAAYIRLLQEFLKHLKMFYDWINGNEIPDINEGYSKCEEELTRSINILNLPVFKRESISKGYIRKFNKTFLYGLSKILRGIRIAFGSDMITSINIEKEQLVRYIFDKVEGLGNRFLFNKIGEDSAANKIKDLPIEELIFTLRLLLRPGNQVRTTRNGWIDLGSGRSVVRILLIKHNPLNIFGKDSVFFIFRVVEHNHYEEKLNTTPTSFRFLPA